MKLYTYYRSTSSYRVRIALALKGLDYQSLPVNLVRDGGEHRQPAYLALNPQGRVPALQVDEGELLIQSPAIIEYLEERYPHPALLSSDPLRRAHERGVAALVGWTSTRCTTPACSTCCASGDTTKSRSGSGSATGSARVSPPSSN